MFGVSVRIGRLMYNVYHLFFFSKEEAGPASSVGRASAWYAECRGLYPPVRQHSFVEIGHEISSTAILPLPLIQVGQLPVIGERTCSKYCLSLPRKSMDMTIAVDWDVKPQNTITTTIEEGANEPHVSVCSEMERADQGFLCQLSW